MANTYLNPLQGCGSRDLCVRASVMGMACSRPAANQAREAQAHHTAHRYEERARERRGKRKKRGRESERERDPEGGREQERSRLPARDCLCFETFEHAASPTTSTTVLHLRRKGRAALTSPFFSNDTSSSRRLCLEAKLRGRPD